MHTPVDAIERWSPAKTWAYYEAAMRLQEIKNGGGQSGESGEPNEMMDALGNILEE